jgi:hypothetical protein
VIHARRAIRWTIANASPATERRRLAIREFLGVVDERPVYVRLTTDQVESIVHVAHGGSAASLAALLSGRVAREGIPPIEVWEERALGETVESRFSFSLVRGLLLLAHLADGQPARLTDLATELNLSAGTARTYVRTLLMAGLVAQDPKTHLYRLAT